MKLSSCEIPAADQSADKISISFGILCTRISISRDLTLTSLSSSKDKRL